MISADLDLVDLCVDETYGGSRNGNASDDPLPRLLGVDNGAGFRHLGQRPAAATLKLLALKTSFSDPTWPDSLDRESGLFVYYGDKREPGDLHDTPRLGNMILGNLFDEAHSQASSSHFPPIFLFGNTGTFRDVQFLGLAVPGAAGMGIDEDLVAVWRTTADRVRFQNYKATFTVLDVPIVRRAWLADAQKGLALQSPFVPKPWLDWVQGRKYTPLLSIPVTTFRSKQEQQPETDELRAYVQVVHQFFQKNPYAFEKCAMEIAKLFLPNINKSEITRPWRDGGRDAIGTYRIGHGAGAVDVEFALEAKCFGPASGVGVKPLSRLISRLRHRQFGILVTTSYLDSQAYRELIDDAHPVVVICGRDMALKLREKLGSLERLKPWLSRL